MRNSFAVLNEVFQEMTINTENTVIVHVLQTTEVSMALYVNTLGGIKERNIYDLLRLLLQTINVLLYFY